MVSRTERNLKSTLIKICGAEFQTAGVSLATKYYWLFRPNGKFVPYHEGISNLLSQSHLISSTGNELMKNLLTANEKP